MACEEETVCSGLIRALWFRISRQWEPRRRVVLASSVPQRAGVSALSDQWGKVPGKAVCPWAACLMPLTV